MTAEQAAATAIGHLAVIPFDHPYAQPPRLLVAELGGKGAHLAEMTTRLGLPVPPGFTITTRACADALERGDLGAITGAIDAALARLEHQTGGRFGDPANPLLVSVRSGAPASMPGMMDTVLNVGTTPVTARGLAARSGDAGFGWDCYTRLAAMFGSAVLGSTADIAGAAAGIAAEHHELGPRIMALDAYLAAVAPLPATPRDQLHAAIRAVILSWNSDRARAYRRIEGIPDRPGTAVTIQAMVFGNLGADSGSGVAFTRDPATGAAGLVGDWLADAQGEDVVAGTHCTGTLGDLATALPDAAVALDRAATILERHLDDMCDIEFTVERGQLWLLQVRVGKRSPRAALRIAAELAEDPCYAIDRCGAVTRVAHLLARPPTASLPLRMLLPDARLLRGIGVSPGIGVGRACFDPDAVADIVAAGDPAVLIRRETSPSDIHGMAAAAAIVTGTGGAMSHAAVVARGWGIPAVVGVDGLVIAADGASIAGVPIAAGAWLSVDGSTGEIALARATPDATPLPEVATLTGWARACGIMIAPLAADSPPATGPGLSDENPVAELPSALLVLLAIKGVTMAEALAEAAMATAADVATTLASLVADGLAEQAKRGHKLTVTGQARAAALLAVERSAHAAGPSAAIESFDAINRDFKTVMTAWQLRADGTPNDHQDRGYDAGVIGRLGDVNVVADAWLAAIDPAATLAPLFRARLARALGRIGAGELQWLLSPRIDSYHSVWFELHEYLIRRAGRSRADEAAAGRAQ